MRQRCSKETGNVKGNGTGSQRPHALPESLRLLRPIVEANCRGPCAKGLQAVDTTASTTSKDYLSESTVENQEHTEFSSDPAEKVL